MAKTPTRERWPNMVGKVWEEKDFQLRLAKMVKRYDESWRNRKTKREFDDDWAFFIIHTTADQARRANDLLALHVENQMERD